MFFSTANQFFKKNQHWQKNHSNEKIVEEKEVRFIRKKLARPPAPPKFFSSVIM